MNKTLILYYSFEGSTAKIANYLADHLGFDTARVTPLNELKSKGFSKYLWGGSQVLMKRKPAIKPIAANLDDYDTIIIGSPIWAGTFAPPIYTMLDDTRLKNKRIAYLYCHEGGAGSAVQKMQTAVSMHNTFLSACECVNVAKNYEAEKEKALTWAKGL